MGPPQSDFTGGVLILTTGDETEIPCSESADGVSTASFYESGAF